MLGDMGLTEEVAGGGSGGARPRMTVKARSRHASRGPWARLLVGAVRHPFSAFRASLDEDARGMLWRPLLVLCLLVPAGSILAGPDEAVATILVTPFVVLSLLAAAAFVALPVHLVARHVFQGRGTWTRTLQAFLWATIPGAGLALGGSLLALAGSGLPEGSPVSLALEIAFPFIVLAALAMQLLLARDFIGTAHSIRTSEGAVSFVSGSLVSGVVIVTLVLAFERWDGVAFAFAWLAFLGAVAGILWLIAGLVATAAWLRARS